MMITMLTMMIKMMIMIIRIRIMIIRMMMMIMEVIILMIIMVFRFQFRYADCVTYMLCYDDIATDLLDM